VVQKDFTQAFATAAEVARSREGDCTEHAVYLAALARARGIPARVAVGLVYITSAQAFGYHMWTEVWIDGRWIPVDATLGQGGIGAGHLKLADSNLAGATAYGSFLPVVQVIGRIQVAVIEAQ
jgi:transglutaminase-like putative cysteine protease